MYSRLEEIISKFENGEERYNTDPMVHNIVNMIYNNEDPLIIIDSLIKSNNQMMEAFHNYMMKHSK
jgi:hypothetical protein